MNILHDNVYLAMIQASQNFGGSDGVFNSAGFGSALRKNAGLKGGLDGRLVRSILSGRPEVQPLRGGCHWQVTLPEPPESNEVLRSSRFEMLR